MNEIFEKLYTLAQAGYTKDDIQELLNTTHPTSTSMPTAEDAASAPIAVTEEPKMVQEDSIYTSLMSEIASLKDMIRKDNILMSQNRGPQSVDTVLASIINPHTKGDDN